MNKKDYDLMEKLKEDFKNRSIEIIQKMKQIENKTINMEEFREVTEENGKVWVNFCEPSVCGCCSDETYSYSFPLEYLFNNNWVEEYKEKIRLENEEKKFKEEQKRIQHENYVQEYELKMLKKLKEKYGEMINAT